MSGRLLEGYEPSAQEREDWLKKHPLPVTVKKPFSEVIDRYLMAKECLKSWAQYGLYQFIPASIEEEMRDARRELDDYLNT